MELSKQDRIIMMEKWLEGAEDEIENLKVLYSMGRYKKVLHCFYYACFNLMSGIMLKDGFSYNSHEQLLGQFNKAIINQNDAFRNGENKILKELMDYRHFSDYSPGEAVTIEECNEIGKKMQMVYPKLKGYLEKSIKELKDNIR